MDFQYETLEKNFDALFSRTGRTLRMQTQSPEAFAAWQQEAFQKLKELLADDVFVRTPMDPVLLSERDCGAYVEKIYRLTTEPETYMPTAILEPKQPAEGAGTVLFLPAHGAGMLSYLDHPDYPQLIAGSRQSRIEAWKAGGETPKTGSLVRQLAEAGIRVVIPEPRGIGLRREKRNQGWSADVAFTWSHNEQGRVAIAMGTSIAAMNAYDFSVALEFAKKDMHEGEKLIAGGHSGGGMMTLYLAALHPEIDACFTSGYFYGVKESLLDMPENCTCNYVPGLWRWFDMCDIAAICAPHPIFIESGSVDHLNGASGLGNVTPQVEQLREAYACEGAAEQVTHHIYSGEHFAGLTDLACLEWVKALFGMKNK